jgi:5-methyltetrahydropteroyltriglutamate--homocysteine methyltransferase
MKMRFEIPLSGEATGSPVVTDGEQRNYHNFCTYCVHGLPNTADGFKIAFSDGHTRPFPLQAVRSFEAQRDGLRCPF